MEVTKFRLTTYVAGQLLRYGLLGLMLLSYQLHAQSPIKKYGISKGAMQITLGKNLPAAELEAFIQQYDLENLALKELLINNFQDSIKSLGWKVVISNGELLVISKPLFSADNTDRPQDRIKLADLNNPLLADLFSSPIRNQVFGYNSFKNKQPFLIKDSVVTFFTRDHVGARQVKLAGNFTSWELNAISMTKVDSGWRASVKLRPGKYLYKFIVDGNWRVDRENAMLENDGMGNDNSVFYFTNYIFRLDTFLQAKRIILSGSFNDWNEKQLQLQRTPNGWQLPIFIAEGTYTYRYIVDGKWVIDQRNRSMVPNEFDDYNSVISMGTEHVFVLPGFSEAKKVYLAGSFNDWRNFELAMSRTPADWRIPYVLGPGNYEFKFFVDGSWVNAEGAKVKKETPGSTFVIEPNYTFRLKGYTTARTVFIAGDFNNWSPNAYAMRKDDNGWTLPMHLEPGKHLYKFVIDDKWVIDPDNALWEQNEYNTGNSVLWIE